MIAPEPKDLPPQSAVGLRRLPSLCYSLADQNVATTKSIGIYNFSIQLLQQLIDDEAVERLAVLVNPTLEQAIHPHGNVVVRKFVAPTDRGIGRILWDQWRVYSAALRSGSQWLFLPKGFASFLRRPPVRLAAYVHDVMGDYYERHYPGFESRREYPYFSRSLLATLRRARVIFTNTDFSRGEILDLASRWKLPPPRVVTAGYGFTTQPFQPVPKENRVLLFASKTPHKRTDLAVQFLDHWLHQSGFDGRIDCIGILSDVLPRPASRAWNWIGRVPPAECREMIRRSRAVVYCSEYEGFGMPPVEAVLEGTCPVYSDIPPIREVMGSAGFAFSNASKEEFARAMTKALAVTAPEIEKWARALLNRHNWRQVVRRIVEELANDNGNSKTQG